MAKVLIVYGSTTGNTFTAAGTIEQELAGNGHTVTLLDAIEAQPDNLCSGWDAVLFGCSTWGFDEIELQSDFIPLYESFDSIGAEGCKTACFGCGNSGYTFFCGAVDAIEEKLEKLGSVKMAAGLKIDGNPSGTEARIRAWAEEVAAAL